MNKYTVHVKVTDYFVVEVEAEDEYAAAMLGEEKWVDETAYDTEVDAWHTELA